MDVWHAGSQVTSVLDCLMDVGNCDGVKREDFVGQVASIPQFDNGESPVQGILGRAAQPAVVFVWQSEHRPGFWVLLLGRVCWLPLFLGGGCATAGSLVVLPCVVIVVIVVNTAPWFWPSVDDVVQGRQVSIGRCGGVVCFLLVRAQLHLIETDVHVLSQCLSRVTQLVCFCQVDAKSVV
eukprot:3322354-Amphidinium_carterae.4